MALIESLHKDIKDRESIHRGTEAKYFIVHNKKGEKFLQIDTYGSDDRQIPGKVSQSIQFSPEAIKQLKDLLSLEFKD